METMTATNSLPRRSRRASMSCMPSVQDDPEGAKALAMGKSKEELYQQYKQEKAARLKAHEDAEEQFRQKTTVQLNETSGLAEQEDNFSSKVDIGVFEMPKVSRRQRRASMGITLQILDPIEDVKLELEEVSKVTMPVSPIASTPTLSSGGLFTGGAIPGAWDGSAGADPTIMFSAETLAGWKTVAFEDGPLGMQLEPTIGDKACKVTGFLDTLGCPSQARASGQIQFDDVIVKVNGKLPKSYEETLEMIAVGGDRVITFRPGFSYELVDLSASMDSPGKGKKKSKVGRVGRRASMGCIPSNLPSSPTDVYSVDKANKKSSSEEANYGYGDMGYGDMGYGDTGYGIEGKSESPKPKNKGTSPKMEKKKSKRGRRASCVAAMPNMPGLVSATDVPKAVPQEDTFVKEEPKKKSVSKRGRRASMSSMPPGAMPGLVSATDVKPAKEEKVKVEKKSSSKKTSCFDALGYEPPEDCGDMGDEPAQPERKVERKKSTKKGRRASIAAMPTGVDIDKSKLAVIEAMESAEAAKKDKKKKKKEKDSSDDEDSNSPKAKNNKDTEPEDDGKKERKKSSSENKSKGKSDDKEKKRKKDSKDKK